jgi:hypothetical protein
MVIVMESKEVIDMIFEALRSMSIGIPGVFSVLAVFYISIKLFMMGVSKKSKKIDEE